PGLGVVARPGLGRARLATDGERLVMRAGPGRPEVPVDQQEGWSPVRHLEAAADGLAIRLGLDDVDPYRHGHPTPPAPRLSEAEVGQWRELLSEAWRLLARRCPHRAEELSAGLRTIVPLARTDERMAASATIRNVFGAFGLTRPPTATDFAVTLVHEFQHS